MDNTAPAAQPAPIVFVQNGPVQAVLPSAPSGPGKKIKIVIISFIVILILTLIGGGTVYAIAYEKIKINNPEVEKKIAQFIQGLPFTPKTPKFLLNSVMTAQEKATSFDFDVSVALKSNGLTSILGVDQGDVSVKGFIDYKDPEKINFSLNGGFATDFNIDVRKKDQFFYLKLNKIPLTILALAGIKDQALIKPVLENWVGIDTTPMNTEARTTLNKQKSENTTINGKVNEELNKLMEKEILNAISVNSEDLDGTKTYKLVFTPNQAVWDFIDQQRNEEMKKQYPDCKSCITTTKTSDMFEKFVLTVWLDQKDYLIKKVEVVADVKSDSPMSYVSPLASTLDSNYSVVPGAKEKTVTSVVGVMKFSAYNQPKNVEVPAKYMTPEEFYSVVMNAINGKKVSANDATRQADIEKIFQLLTACYQDSTPHTYPKTLDDLKSCKNSAVAPVDPDTGQPYEYIPTNAARSKFTLKAKLDAGGYYEANEGGIIKNDSLGTTPTELLKRSRDVARLSDLANLRKAINVVIYNEVVDKTTTLEDAEAALFCQGMSSSPKICSGSSLSGSRNADGTGWMKINFNPSKSVSIKAVLIPTLPIDPTNDATHKYIYCANEGEWEIITVLESIQESSKMASDGGSDPTKYEVGSNFNLLNKVPGCTY